MLIWLGLSARPRPATTTRKSSKLREQLAQAGLSSISPAQLLAMQVLVALLVTTVSVVATSSIAVSVVFGLFAALLPRMLVTRLRHKRQADLRELWPEVVDNLTSGVRAGLS